MVFFGTGNAWQPHRPHSAGPAEGGAAPSADAPAQSDGVRAETRLPTAGVLDELSSALASARAALSNYLDLISGSSFTVRARPERHEKEQA